MNHLERLQGKYKMIIYVVCTLAFESLCLQLCIAEPGICQKF